jgi:hypothetical protein
LDALINGLFELIGRLFGLAFSIILIILSISALIWLIFNWEDILEWFYGLTPHPATDIVTQRIHGGDPLDGPLFAEIMRSVPGDPIEQRVRADQARRLAEMAREAAQARVEQLQRLKAKAVEEVAFIRAQEELRKAVEEHELALARLEALEKWRRRHA